MYYRGFKVVQESNGYRIYVHDIECGFYFTYSDAVSVIDAFYRLREEKNGNY